MIVQEEFQLEENGWILIRTYSDSGFKIQQDGTDNIYDEAVDPKFTNRTYTETNIPIDDDEELSEIEQKAEAFDFLTGRDKNDEQESIWLEEI